MNTLKTFGPLLAALTLVSASTLHRFQEPEVSPESAQTEDPWLVAGRPGAGHQPLQRLVGTFDVQMTFYGGPEPIQQQGVWTAVMTMAGRYVESTYEADFMDQPFLGRSVTGYSNPDQTYKSVWWDGLSTNIDYSVGYLSEDGERLTMLGATTNPATGQSEDYQDVTEFRPEGYRFERTLVVGDQRTRSMVGVFTRR